MGDTCRVSLLPRNRRVSLQNACQARSTSALHLCCLEKNNHRLLLLRTRQARAAGQAYFSVSTAIMSTVMVRPGSPTPWTINFEAAGGRFSSKILNRVMSIQRAASSSLVK